jgi:hypothetical protein
VDLYSRSAPGDAAAGCRHAVAWSPDAAPAEDRSAGLGRSTVASIRGGRCNEEAAVHGHTAIVGLEKRFFAGYGYRLSVVLAGNVLLVIYVWPWFAIWRSVGWRRGFRSAPSGAEVGTFLRVRLRLGARLGAVELGYAVSMPASALLISYTALSRQCCGRCRAWASAGVPRSILSPTSSRPQRAGETAGGVRGQSRAFRQPGSGVIVLVPRPPANI